LSWHLPHLGSLPLRRNANRARSINVFDNLLPDSTDIRRRIARTGRRGRHGRLRLLARLAMTRRRGGNSAGGLEPERPEGIEARLSTTTR